tara:strand:- start:1708 stop:1947 length:240 start_codon:yes stop_codon:yes gene_type:complete
MNKFIEDLKEEHNKLRKEFHSLILPEDSIKYGILKGRLNELDASIRYYSSKGPKEYIGIVEDKVGVKRFEIIKNEKIIT